MARVVGREALVGEIRGLLRSGEPVALHGVAGVGKSALLDHLEQQARASGDAVVLRSTGVVEESSLSFTALRDLLAQCPPDLLDVLPAGARAAIDSGLVGLVPTEALCTELGVALVALWRSWSARTRLLVLLDDVQWLDGASSTVVGYARRRLPGRVWLVATVGSEARGTPTVDVTGLRHLEVPPLEEVDLVDLLCGPTGVSPVSAEVARRVHLESGGIPATALILAGAAGTRPTLLGEPISLPRSLAQVLAERFAAQPEAVRETLLHAALHHRPTVRLLARGGRAEAEKEVGHARRAGLLAAVGPGGPGSPGGPDGAASELRFLPPALREIVTGSFSASERAGIHRRLAEVAPTRGEQLRHRALASSGPSVGLAVELGEVAERTAAEGAPALAAELYLLAADAAPLDLAPRRTEWLVAAVETAATGNHADLVRRALADLAHTSATPDQTVRVRLAIPELAGGAATMLEEVLTAALADAGADPSLVARVLLQRARIAMMRSRPHEATRAAGRAVDLLEQAADPGELALGLTTLAVAERWVGADHRATLGRALALAGPDPTEPLHTSPHYMAARFAFYDDRLEEAWSAFMAMLARVPRGAGADHVHVLRCLVEVACRSGRCAQAVEYAARATDLAGRHGLDGHTSWFIAAQAELVAGDVGRARVLAERGAAAAEETGDARYLQRHLIVLGQARLRLGDAQGAAVALTRVRDLEREGDFDDPTVNRWHADLVSARTRLGELGAAAELVEETRHRLLERHPEAAGVLAQLDRAEAELSLALGDLDRAEALAERAASGARSAGLALEVGCALVVRGHVERRRRRLATARTTLAQALEVFVALRATTWAAEVRVELSPQAPPAPEAAGDLLARLTDTETRIAGEVAAGASNREIAARTFVSVKTVEATLTRIYRKLDVRSRTQLATLLAPGAVERID